MDPIGPCEPTSRFDIFSFDCFPDAPRFLQIAQFPLKSGGGREEFLLTSFTPFAIAQRLVPKHTENVVGANLFFAPADLLKL